MIKNSDSLKAKIANLAKAKNIPNKYIIQNFMFEALIRRIALSNYKDKFIIKGGFLLSSIFGVNLRSTMDLDATIKGISVHQKIIEKIIKEIIKINVNDNILLELENIKKIRLDAECECFNVNIKANFDGLKANLIIDITTGDVITYKEVEYNYKTLFTNEYINIMAYNYETIMAEKFESIISRYIDNTRMKDYYDLYMFTNTVWQNVNKNTLKVAIENTFHKRKSEKLINESKKLVKNIAKDEKLNKLWRLYQKNYEYAKNITFADTINALEKIIAILDLEENNK